jgi:hypothetical protein
MFVRLIRLSCEGALTSSSATLISDDFHFLRSYFLRCHLSPSLIRSTRKPNGLQIPTDSPVRKK